MQHPKELSKLSQEAFAHWVPEARRVREAVFRFAGAKGAVRVKRAKSTANQIQVWRREPIVLHVPPDQGAERWYVLPVDWQLERAREGNAQHALDARVCMSVQTSAIPKKLIVEPTNLNEACIKALRAINP